MLMWALHVKARRAMVVLPAQQLPHHRAKVLPPLVAKVALHATHRCVSLLVARECLQSVAQAQCARVVQVAAKRCSVAVQVHHQQCRHVEVPLAALRAMHIVVRAPRAVLPRAWARRIAAPVARVAVLARR